MLSESSRKCKLEIFYSIRKRLHETIYMKFNRKSYNKINLYYSRLFQVGP